MAKITIDPVRNSVMTDRSLLASKAGYQFGGDRDIWGKVGYKRSLDYSDYRAYYDRGDIAGIVVDRPAIDTWKSGVRVQDSGGPEGEFARAFRSFDKRVGLVKELATLDRISGIGRYGGLYIGLDDMIDPRVKYEGSGNVVYVRAFDEGSASIEEFVKDKFSPRVGLPKSYKIKIAEVESFSVHHTRFIHVTEDPVHSRVYGRPRLERVFNRLMDLLKVVAGSSEAFWLLVNRGLAITIDPEVDPSTIDEDSIKEKLEDYTHGLTRYVWSMGGSFESLGTDPVDPSGLFEVIVSLIAAASGIPQRILLGSERGELASSADLDNWASVVEDRRRNHAEPNILRRVIDWLISYDFLPAPEGGEYSLIWGPVYAPTAKEQAETLSAIAEAISKLAPAGPDTVVDVAELIRLFLDVDVVDLEAIIDEEES